jgi:hypothetical protein
LWWHFAGVEAGGDNGDGDVRTPARGSFDTDSNDAVRCEHVDRCDVAGCSVRERLVGELDAVGVDDADREAVLVRVEPATAGAIMKVSCRVVGAVR